MTKKKITKYRRRVTFSFLLVIILIIANSIIFTLDFRLLMYPFLLSVSEEDDEDLEKISLADFTILQVLGTGGMNFNFLFHSLTREADRRFKIMKNFCFIFIQLMEK